MFDFLLPTAHAATQGITLDGNVVTGATKGIAEVASSLEDTLNNQYLVTFAVMFIGIAAAVGLVMMLVKRHKHVGGGSYYGSRDWMLGDTEMRLEVNRHKMKDYRDKVRARAGKGPGPWPSSM